MYHKILHEVYIGVGSNLGDRQQNIAAAITHLSRLDGTTVTKASPIYETEPVGGPEQGRYLNGVLEILTSHSPHRLLNELIDIEKQLGRTRKGRNLPRTIDLDILLYDDIILTEKDLVIPHPRMNERDFVIRPLNEIRA
jgi:2-amino-4-hydroxy-6-hydroxymethyldihydropteridine diphosphokinase